MRQSPSLLADRSNMQDQCFRAQGCCSFSTTMSIPMRATRVCQDTGDQVKLADGFPDHVLVGEARLTAPGLAPTPCSSAAHPRSGPPKRPQRPASRWGWGSRFSGPGRSANANASSAPFVTGTPTCTRLGILVMAKDSDPQQAARRMHKERHTHHPIMELRRMLALATSSEVHCEL